MSNNTQLALREDASIFSSGEKFEIAGRMAASLSKSTIVPKEFQNNANNALIAIELANRLGVSPLMVMQNLYVIYGRPSWSAQYMIAMINGSGKYDFELQYDEKTDKNGKPFSCQCWTERHGRKVTGPIVDMDMAKAEGWINKSGSKWQTMPQMMLRYRAASFFGRMNCPELTMGIYTREEVIEIGADNLDTIHIEEKVKNDIAANANSQAFEEEVIDAEVVEAPTTPIAPTAPTEPVAEAPQPEKPKRGRPPKSQTQPKPETPAPEVVTQPEINMPEPEVEFAATPEWE